MLGCAEGSINLAVAQFRKGDSEVQLQGAIANQQKWVKLDPKAGAQRPMRLRISSLLAAQGDAGNLRPRMRTVFFPPPTRWRRPSSEGAECCRRKPGRCWGGVAGKGPGAAGRGWRDAVPGKRCWVPVRKVNTDLPSQVPGAPYVRLPMLGAGGHFARLCTTLHSRVWSSGGGKGCVPQERKFPGGVRASGRRASV